MIEIISDVVVALSLFALFTSILINFVENRINEKKVKKRKNSIVETGTMTLFFLGFYSVIRFNIGDLMVDSLLKTAFVIIGLSFVVFGCILNIMGRFNLGANWGNQIRIYRNHELVQTGLYGIVRHPLYASLILMFFGASIAYVNYVSLLMNCLVFIPFMYYRAKQEEKLLSRTFEEYRDYRKRVGMFFPRFWK